jgi:hypothetical protein
VPVAATSVVPANAGIQRVPSGAKRRKPNLLFEGGFDRRRVPRRRGVPWIPVCAGMTGFLFRLSFFAVLVVFAVVIAFRF